MVGSKYPAAKMTRPPPTSSGLSRQPLELSPPGCPQVSRTRHVQKVTMFSKPGSAVCKRHVDERHGLVLGWKSGNPSWPPLPCPRSSQLSDAGPFLSDLVPSSPGPWPGWGPPPEDHLILRHPLSLPPSVFPSIRVSSNESHLCIKWPKYWSFSFSPSNVAQRVKRLPSMQETWVRSLGGEDPLEKEMAAHSSILAWKTPWVEKPGGLATVHGLTKSWTRLSDFTNEYSGLISFRIDWFDLLAVQGTLKSLLQHHSSKASILRQSAFFTVQLSHLYLITGKTIALTT